MRTAVAILALAAFVAACESDPTGTSNNRIDRLPRSLTVTEQHIASSTTDFGLDLLRRVLAARKDGGNVMLSPLSASMALGMTLNGAAGETYDGMARTLQLSGLSADEINPSYRDLIDMLVALDPAVEVGIANSVWYRQGLEIEPLFVQTVEESFDAEVSPIDITSPDAPGIINAWVSDATHGKIDEIVDRVPAGLVAYLINAVYFKGEWTLQFDRADTRDGPFTREDGSTVTVPFMNSERADFDVLRNPLFTALDLGYGGGPYRMTILVPADGVSLAQLVGALDADSWRTWMQGFQTENTTISIPKYRLEYDVTLNEVLAAMGMDAAFDSGRADFSRLVRSGGWISEVKQKTFIDVNEEGTEAAAVTSVVIIESMPVPVVVDRPFVVAIRERLSGTLLFLGAIVDPSA